MKLPQLIGVIHLPPLAGAPRAGSLTPVEALQEAGMLAVREAAALVKAGFNGIILENFGDTPFYKDRVPPETIASLSIIAAAVREAVEVPIGINVLRNDARSALAIAAVTGCDFIRVNVISGVTATDQGLIEGDAAFLIRERARLQTPVQILADVHVKHGLSLSSSDLNLAIEEVGGRALVDGVIVTGKTTGRLIDLSALQAASQVAKSHQIPIFLGSGATQDTLSEVKPWVDGIIVGSALRKKGQAGAELDMNRIRDFVKAFTKSRQKPKMTRKKSSNKQ